MIERKVGMVVVACNKCGQLREDKEWRSYKVAWQEAQNAGWTARAVGKGWEHDCPDCQAGS